MSGLRRGAMPTNQALARSVPVPRLVVPALWLTTCAVPVLPAKSMPSRCDGSGGPGGRGRGHGVGDDLPVFGCERNGLVAGAREGLVDGLKLVGGHFVREDDMRAASGLRRRQCRRGRAQAECGVAVTAPWPMPTEITSPAYHFSCWVLSFHTVEGMVPETSSGRSMPVFCEKPSEVAYLAMVSMPSLLASV